MPGANVAALAQPGAATPVRPQVSAQAVPPQTQPASGTTGVQVSVQQAGVRFVAARYVDGPRALTVGRTTRVSVTYTVQNPYGETLDYSHTVLFSLGEGVAAVSADPDHGSAAIEGEQVRWGGFVLGPGERASMTMILDLTPTADTADRPMTIITTTRTTARTLSGGFIEVHGDGLDTTAVAGLARGGFVVLTAAQFVDLRGRATQAVVAIARTGTGLVVESNGTASVGLFAIGLIVAAPLLLSFSQRRRSAVPSSGTASRFCTRCGRASPVDDRYCRQCGSRYQPDDLRTLARSRTVSPR